MTTTHGHEEEHYLPYPFPLKNKQAPLPYHTQVGYRLPQLPTDRQEGYATSFSAAVTWWNGVKQLIEDTELVDPVFSRRFEYVIGWRPMTQAERERSDAARDRARAQAAKRKQTKEQQERELLAKLQAKYS